MLGDKNTVTRVNLKKTIGKGYKTFWGFKGRYRIVKGGRGSKKSTTTAIWFIYNMMKYYHQYNLKPNTLVIRRYYNTHKDSTFAQLKWAIKKLQVNHLWKVTKSPLELTYKASGQKILFRGLDDPHSITSITVDDGFLCWVWWEEFFQVSMEDDFNKVDLSIRGELPAGLFKQHTMIMNPWSSKHFSKKRFFDNVDSNGISDDGSILAQTRNYDCNEFLGEDDLKIFNDMKERNPKRYNVEGLGNWGISEGLVFTNWEEKEFDIERTKKDIDLFGNTIHLERYGMDFGYTNDPTAFIAILVNRKDGIIYIYDEIYKTKLKNKDIYKEVKRKGYEHKKIAADSSAPKDIDELQELGLNNIFGQSKPQGSVRSGIHKIQDYKLIVHPRCENTIIELNNYTFQEDKTGKLLNDPIDEYNHLMDALRYAMFDVGESNFSW